MNGITKLTVHRNDSKNAMLGTLEGKCKEKEKKKGAVIKLKERKGGGKKEKQKCG